MEPNVQEAEQNRLYALLASAQTPQEVQALLQDICTTKEIAYMAQRVQCAKMLMGGATYEEVIASTDISSATLSRVSRCVREGTGGYNRILRAFLQEEDPS